MLLDGGPQEQQRVESPGIMIPPSTPTGYDFEVDQAPSTPAAEDVFDTASPLTPMSSSQERDTPGSPIESPEDMLPASHTAPQNATRRKRKRTLSKANGARNSRRKREPQSQDIPRLAASTEDTHVDPSIWPPVIGDIAENRMVRSIQSTVTSSTPLTVLSVTVYRVRCVCEMLPPHLRGTRKGF